MNTSEPNHLRAAAKIKSTISRYTSLLFGLIAALVVIGLMTFTSTHDRMEVYAQGSTFPISGYAWSDTIGWISFNGGSYGLSVDESGTISGYAWSDNIGWISANAADLVGCPSGTCTANMDGDGVMTGWLRALSGGTSQSGGWDGFISLSGTGYGPVRQVDGSFAGYAWGDTVVGWVNFSYASTNYMAEPTAVLKVRKVGETEWQDGLTIEMLEEIELGWNQEGAENTTSCVAVPPANGFGTDDAVSGIDSDVEEPIGNTSLTYRLLCYGEGGSQDDDSVIVSATGGEGAQFCNSIGFVHRGSDISLCYELGTNEPALCSIKAGAADVVAPLVDSTGEVPYENIIGEVTFTLECTGGDSDTMTVKILPEFQET
jgi:hypothetical protein